MEEKQIFSQTAREDHEEGGNRIVSGSEERPLDSVTPVAHEPACITEPLERVRNHEEKGQHQSLSPGLLNSPMRNMCAPFLSYDSDLLEQEEVVEG